MVHRRGNGIVTFAAVLLLAGNAPGASISQTGADGANGADGLSSPPAPTATSGDPGGPAASASALAGGNADPSNDATATGGKGGTGGAGGNVSSGVGLSGGSGGSGGAAQARAETNFAGAAATATSQATGGAGGTGGPGSVGTPFSGGGGFGGNGGSADAQSVAHNGIGTSTAAATAVAGSGGAGGITPGSETPSFLQGFSGGANAHAEALGEGDASATALSVSGPVFSPAGNTMHASASANSNSGNAFASAEMRAASQEETPVAQAFAAHGDATAVSRLVGDGEISSISASNGASGGASGKLLLVQEVVSSQTARPHVLGHGDPFSVLSGQNAYGGSLEVRSSAIGGSETGTSVAQATGVSTAGAPVAAFALASGAASALSGDPLIGTRTDATATVFGPQATSLFGSATGASYNAALMYSKSNLAITGSAVEGHASLQIGDDLVTTPFTGMSLPPDSTGMSVTANTAANHAAPQLDPATLGPRLGAASIFLVPGQTDVEAWTAGNPNAQAEIAGGGQVLALGSLAMAGDARGDFHYQGSLGASFQLAGPDSHGVRVAFLDPTAVGAFDTLHLSFKRNGTTLLEKTFASPSELLAGLDDVVIPLGQAFQPGLPSNVELAFDVVLLHGAADPSLSFDFAVLSTLPEPPGLGLAGLGILLALGLIRRRA
jgi:hypothetical protein